MRMQDLSALSYRPVRGERLFHYCSNETLWSIVMSNSLWLSSIYALNDHMELKWGRGLAERLLKRHNRELPMELRIAVVSTFAQADAQVLPLLFSLSRNGDLLSQWRAYASDGQGVALEFDAERLHSVMPVSMKDVLYNFRDQVRVVYRSLLAFASWSLRGDAGLKAVLEVLPYFAVDLLSLKHPGFFEEQEVRMIHLLSQEGESLSDPGGHTESSPAVSGVEVQRRQVRGEAHPYVALPIDLAKILTGVVLGPKNPHDPKEVEARLQIAGMPAVRIRRSVVPYY